MPDVDDAVKLVTDPANVSRSHASGPEQVFAVKQTRVLKKLREDGAGRAEARELALQALDKVGGGVDVRAARGNPRAARSLEREVENWWVPAEAVRF
jgi:hypothetical protein